MPNLVELMTPEDQATVKKWAEEKLNPKHKQDIPTPFFVAAQLGYYYGWEAVVDYRRGYHMGLDDEGKPIKLAFEFTDAVALIKAAEKVHYRLKLDEGSINAATNVSSNDRVYAKRNADYVNNIAHKAWDK